MQKITPNNTTIIVIEFQKTWTEKGFTTEHCVEMTMNTLSPKGYHCILIANCTATKSKRLQEKVEKRQITATMSSMVQVFAPEVKK